MEKSKNSKPRDRLSELPDSLIFEIFWLLPMREVVRTTLLSHRWENLWTAAPYLNFEEFKEKVDADKVRKFMNRALMLRSETKIQKFKLDFGTHINKSLYDDIDSWLHFAKNHQVQELHVDLQYGLHTIFKDGYTVDSTKVTKEELYWAPRYLYSCSSLKKMHLKGCNLNIPKKEVSWNDLEYLSIDGYVLNQDLISCVLSGSPKLKIFLLKFMENREDLCIESGSLRYLRVKKYLFSRDDEPSTNTEFRISTPNLKNLTMGEVSYSKFSTNNVLSLTCANLGFDGLFEEATKSYCSHDLFSRNDFVGETLKQILPTVQNKILLSDWCIKALGEMKNKNMLSPIPNVENLWLYGCFQEYEEIVHVLEIFPKLKKLTLKIQTPYKRFHCKEPLEFEANLPNPSLQELRAIKITWVEVGLDDYSIFPLIEILLKYASKLEKMVFRVKETPPPSSSFFMTLLNMPRSSPAARLIFK